MNIGNSNIKAGERIDTGKKWIDANGDPHVIYQKVLNTTALANAGARNVAHGESIGLSKYANVVGGFVTNGVTIIPIGGTAGAEPICRINATNVVITSTTDLSTYSGQVIIEFCLA